MTAGPDQMGDRMLRALGIVRTPDGFAVAPEPAGTVTLDDLRHLFDLAVDTPLVCSGSFDTDDVNVLRRIATTLGVDPNDPNITPDEFISQYPHPHKRRAVRTEPGVVGWYEDRKTGETVAQYAAGRAYHSRYENPEEIAARVAEERADNTCQAGPGGRPCGKLPDDPIHVQATPPEPPDAPLTDHPFVPASHNPERCAYARSRTDASTFCYRTVSEHPATQGDPA